MSGFAIRMSAYKTVNKRADPKRNFAASLARSGYTASRKSAGKGSRSMAFGEERVKRTSRAREEGGGGRGREEKCAEGVERIGK